MLQLTFGEQVKIVLKRKNMTIKQLAEIMEETTGKKMSRQNLTQRLNRDNFQEQDMRLIAAILECPFQLSILGDVSFVTKSAQMARVVEEPAGVAVEKPVGKIEESKELEEEPIEEFEEEVLEPIEEFEEAVLEPLEEFEKAAEEPVGLTVGDLIDIQQEDIPVEDTESTKMSLEELLAEVEALEREGKAKEGRKEEINKKAESGWFSGLRGRRKDPKNGKPVDEKKKEVNIFSREDEPQDLQRGEMNPETGEEYLSNTVRMNKKRIGYVDVYSRKDHGWKTMTEWAYMGEQERKKNELGEAYEPPIYLD